MESDLTKDPPVPAPELPLVSTAIEYVVVDRTVTVNSPVIAGPARLFPDWYTMSLVVRLCGTAVVTTHGFAFVADVIGITRCSDEPAKSTAADVQSPVCTAGA